MKQLFNAGSKPTELDNKVDDRLIEKFCENQIND